jgi:DNA repair exonuclease SbcCD ATPase subunit
MALPKAVQAQLEEAERLQQSLSDIPPEDHPQVVPVDGNASEVEATTEAPEQIRQEPEVTSDPEKDIGYWKHRFDSLEGVYESRLSRANEAAQQAEERARRIEAELADLKNQFTQSQQEKRVSSLVTDDDVEAFGNDLIDLQKRVAKQVYAEAKAEFSAERQQLEAKIADLQKQLGGVNERVGHSDYDRFIGRVSQMVPDWEQVNQNQGFLKWLGEVDPMLGKPRQALMDEAAVAQDANRVSAIFNAYKSLVGKPEKKSNTDLQRQVSPSKTASSVAKNQTASDGRVWSQREIQQFYQDVAQNRIPADKAAQIEAELNAAVVEGRVM